MTGREVKPEDLILQSERVYNFQRIFNLKMGFGRRAHDAIPYRAAGPGDRRRVRVAPGALRQAAQGGGRASTPRR